MEHEGYSQSNKHNDFIAGKVIIIIMRQHNQIYDMIKPLRVLYSLLSPNRETGDGTAGGRSGSVPGVSGHRQWHPLRSDHMRRMQGKATQMSSSAL